MDGNMRFNAEWEVCACVTAAWELVLNELSVSVYFCWGVALLCLFCLCACKNEPAVCYQHG